MLVGGGEDYTILKASLASAGAVAKADQYSEISFALISLVNISMINILLQNDIFATPQHQTKLGWYYH